MALHNFERLAYTQKRDAPKDISFLAQKTRFELVLRFSHTTPLAGEPLEPLGYFCIAQYSSLIQKAILLYHIFSGLSKIFAVKNEKSFLFFSLKARGYKNYNRAEKTTSKCKRWGAGTCSMAVLRDFGAKNFAFAKEKIKMW